MIIYTSDRSIHHSNDRAILNPTWKDFGVFETMLWRDGKLHDWREHLKRYEASLIHIRSVPSAFTDGMECISEMVKTLVEKNDIRGDARVRLSMKREREICYDSVVESFQESLVVAPYKIPSGPAQLVSANFRPETSRDLAGHKSLSYHQYVESLAEAQKSGASEAVLFNEKDEVVECATSNLFWIKDGVVYTPSLASGCLPGVMRGLLIERMREAEIPLREGSYFRSDLIDADAVFITNSLRRVQPVGSFENVKYASPAKELLSQICDPEISSV